MPRGAGHGTRAVGARPTPGDRSRHAGPAMPGEGRCEGGGRPRDEERLGGERPCGLSRHRWWSPRARESSKYARPHTRAGLATAPRGARGPTWMTADILSPTCPRGPRRARPPPPRRPRAILPATWTPRTGSSPSARFSSSRSPRCPVPPRPRPRRRPASGSRRPNPPTTAAHRPTTRPCATCGAWSGASRWVKVVSYGASAQGRDLPLVVVSRDRAFTPAAAARLGKPVVLVQACIHAGESEGKDAALALVRDLAVLRTRAALLDGAVLLIAPILSPDSHERRGPYNRINQNGPEEMGWRATATGLNLNRDYMKAEAPEMRALLSQVFTRWCPHLLVDDAHHRRRRLPPRHHLRLQPRADGAAAGGSAGCSTPSRVGSCPGSRRWATCRRRTCRSAATTRTRTAGSTSASCRRGSRTAILRCTAGRRSSSRPTC